MVGAKYCPKCGAEVTDQKKSEPVYTATVLKEEPEAYSHQEYQEVKKPEVKKKPVFGIIALISSLLGFALPITYVFAIVGLCVDKTGGNKARCIVSMILAPIMFIIWYIIGYMLGWAMILSAFESFVNML